MNLTIVEHKSSSYGPRTWHNAKTADLTVAIAVDFETYGEKLTAKAADPNYIAIPFDTPSVQAARILYRELKRRDAKVLNVAGNGIYSFVQRKILPQAVDMYVFMVLGLLIKHYPLKKIISGGQTGVDMAGAIAGCKLGIPVELTFPNGFRQRDEHRVDSNHTEAEIRHQVLNAMARLVTP